MEDQQQDPEQVDVKLKPIAGVSPKVYVPVVYAVTIALLLFLILVLPGIRTNGTHVTFLSSPSNAAIFVDENYVGSTPGTYFVEAGTRAIQVSRPGFDTARENRSVGGRLFGSWLFPRRETIRFTLRAQSPDGLDLVEDAAAAFADWAVTGEASSRFEFPPLGRALAGDLSALSGEGNALAAWRQFLYRSLPAVGGEALLLDLTSGTISVAAETQAATPTGLAGLIGAIADAPAALPLQLVEVLRDEREALLRDAPWYAEAAANSDPVVTAEPAVAPRSPVEAVGLTWIPFGPQSVLLSGESGADRGGEFARRRSIPPLYVSQTEVPVSLFQRFVSENPLWAPENRAALVSAGLVDEHYLSEFATAGDNPTLPITGISAFAAEAFASWLSESAGPAVTVRLPSEDEWDVITELAEPVSGVFAGDTMGVPVPVDLAGESERGVLGLIGNVWEWTTTPFAYFSYLYPPEYAAADRQRVVRGGGAATSALGFSRFDRGALPPFWTSPFVGIRLVLVIDG